MLNDSEVDLAWELADIVGDGVPVDDRHSLYITLGLGEISAAIRNLLVHVVEQRILLPTEIFLDVKTWAQGYEGSPDDAWVSSLLDRVYTV